MKDVFCKWNCAKILPWGSKGGGGGGVRDVHGISAISSPFYYLLHHLPPPLHLSHLYIKRPPVLRLCQVRSDIRELAAVFLGHAWQPVKLSNSQRTIERPISADNCVRLKIKKKKSKKFHIANFHSNLISVYSPSLAALHLASPSSLRQPAAHIRAPSFFTSASF